MPKRSPLLQAGEGEGDEDSLWRGRETECGSGCEDGVRVRRPSTFDSRHGTEICRPSNPLIQRNTNITQNTYHMYFFLQIIILSLRPKKAMNFHQHLPLLTILFLIPAYVFGEQEQEEEELTYTYIENDPREWPVNSVDLYLAGFSYISDHDLVDLNGEIGFSHRFGRYGKVRASYYRTIWHFMSDIDEDFDGYPANKPFSHSLFNLLGSYNILGWNSNVDQKVVIKTEEEHFKTTHYYIEVDDIDRKTNLTARGGFYGGRNLLATRGLAGKTIDEFEQEVEFHSSTIATAHSSFGFRFGLGFDWKRYFEVDVEEYNLYNSYSNAQLYGDILIATSSSYDDVITHVAYPEGAPNNDSRETTVNIEDHNAHDNIGFILGFSMDNQNQRIAGNWYSHYGVEVGALPSLEEDTPILFRFKYLASIRGDWF